MSDERRRPASHREYWTPKRAVIALTVCGIVGTLLLLGLVAAAVLIYIAATTPLPR